MILNEYQPKFYAKKLCFSHGVNHCGSSGFHGVDCIYDMARFTTPLPHKIQESYHCLDKR